MSTTDEGIVIKGIREGLLVTIGSDDGEWAELTSRLAMRIDEQKAFFKGARVALDVGDRPVRLHELDSLKVLLSKRGITLWAVVSSSVTTQGAARNLGLETSLVPQQEQMEAPEISPDEVGDPSILINHTLRSGRSVHYDGHVIIFGDVNPGASIVAGGNVIVWGRVRGTVHAGANGNESAIVCALDLVPTQLRIANYITVAPEDKRRKPRPEMAAVRQGRIVAEPWSG